MKFMEKAKRFFTLNAANHEGFTLVELIVVIAILAILAGVAVPAYSGYIKRAEKAGDLQLLAAVNDAFAAACMVDNKATTQISGAELQWSGDKVVGIKTVNGADPAVVKENFDTFWGTNKEASFKFYEDGMIIFRNGVFVGLDDKSNAAVGKVFQSIINNEAYAGSIKAVQDSGLAEIGAEKLLGTVDGVTGLAQEMLSTGGGKIYDMIFDEEGKYVSNLADTMGMTKTELEEYMETMDTEDQIKFLANSTVLSVAGTVNSNSYDRDRVNNILASGDIGTIISGVNSSPEGLADAALVFGMYTAYTKGEGEQMNSLADLKTIGSDPGFTEYLKTIGTEGSTASKDLDGYYAALDIVNGAVSESPEAANQIMTGGYNNSDLQAMLQQVMGK